MKCVILARVSTREQELEGLSLDNQLRAMENYAKNNDFQVEHIFRFSETADSKIRQKFQEVINLVKARSDIGAIIAYRVDRITRNFRDAVEMDNLRIEHRKELHFVQDRLVIKPESVGKEVTEWDTKVYLAKQYLNRLKEDAANSAIFMIRNKQWPSRAPLGYKNVQTEDGRAWIIPDPETSILIVRAFKWYASGEYSTRSLAKKLRQEGLTPITKRGGYIGTSQTHRLLNNPFYYGEMPYKDKLYPHKYEPLVSRELWDECQRIMKGWHKQPFKYASKPFVFRGLRCANCDCTITTERKKDRYNYLRCTKYRGDCGTPRIKEEKLIAQIEQVFSDISLPYEKLEAISKAMRDSHEEKIAYHQAVISKLQHEYQEIDRKLEVMYDDRLNGRITAEIYDKKLIEFKAQQQEIELRLGQHTKADESYYITASYLLDLASRAAELFESSKPEQKRQLIGLVLSNLKLRGQTLEFTLKGPFAAIARANKSQVWGG